MANKEISKMEEQLLIENQKLRLRLAELEATLNSIHNGEGDVVKVNPIQGGTKFSFLSSETPYRLFLEELSEGLAMLTVDGVILYCNDQFTHLFSLMPQNTTGIEFCQIFPEQEKQKLNDLLKLGKERRCSGELEFTDPVGRKHYLNISLFPAQSVETTDVCVIALDITDQKLNEINVKKFNRIYALLSNINHAIVRTGDKQMLLDQACRIAVNDGGFLMAWVGMVNTTTNKVDVIASSGKTVEYLKGINIDLNDELRSSGPTGQALKYGKSVFSNNIETDEKMIPWRKNALKYGFRSSITLPIIVSDKTIGAYSMYSEETDFFNEDEIILLDEMASDLSFALEFIKSESERIQAEEKLLAEQALRNSIELSLNSGIAIVNDEGSQTYVNPYFCKLLGWSEEELIGKTAPFAYWPSDQLQAIGEAFQLTLADKAPKEGFELIFVRKDGVRMSVQAIISPFSDGNQRLGWLANVIDITERKQVEEALHRTTMRLELALNSSNSGVWDWDVPSDSIVWSPQLYDLFGVDMRTVNPSFDTWRALLLPDDLVNAELSIEVALKEHISYQSDYRVLLPDATIRWINATGEGYYDDNGKVLRMVGICQDITARKQAEEVIRIHSERLQNLHQIDQAMLKAIESPEMVVYIALQFMRSLLQCQRASVSILDLENKEIEVFAADVSGKSIVKIDTVLTEEVYKNIDELRQNKVEIVENSSILQAPSAINKILQAKGMQSFINVALISELKMYGVLNVGWKNARIITSEEIEIANEVAIQITNAIEKARLLKVTRRYSAELEARVIQRTAELEQSNKELEAFSYSVSHDLRAPLRHINGYIDLLKNRFHDLLPEIGKHYLDSIADSARLMGIMIDDLLQFSRTGRLELHQIDLDMNTILKEALQSITQDIPERNIKWRLTPLPHVKGDYNLLQLVWANLLSNAVKFTQYKENTVIEIGFTEEGNEYVFYVKDNGAGFDMQYAQKLFGVFQRLHSSDEFEGTGIGLANVRRIIIKHGGRTWAEAELDKGAIFYFTLPKNKEMLR